jgi:hypothetical protein
VSGRCRIGLTLRHSETGPGGRDMTGAYEMNIDGNNVALDWVEFGVNQTGNAYFGRVLTEELRLDAPQRISVTTKQPWCALRERFTLIPVE